MHFRWLNNKTVQCNISREEVDQLGYSIEDLLVNQEASKGFVSKIVELAKKSINYEPTSTNMCMQVIGKPDGSLTILLSEADSVMDGSSQIPDSLKSILENIRSNINNHDSGVEIDIDEDMDFDMSENEVSFENKRFEDFLRNLFEKNIPPMSKEEVSKIVKETAEKEMKAPKLFKFDSLDDVRSYAKVSTYGDRVSSALYKDQETGAYFLLVKKGKLKLEDYTLTYQELSEFAEFISSNYYIEQFCKEHFKPLIKTKALYILNSYDF